MKTRQSDKTYQDTEQHRHECEVRYCLSKDDDWIKTHLAGVFEKRGESAYNKLRKDVAKLYKRKEKE